MSRSFVGNTQLDSEKVEFNIINTELKLHNGDFPPTLKDITERRYVMSS